MSLRTEVRDGVILIFSGCSCLGLGRREGVEVRVEEVTVVEGIVTEVIVVGVKVGGVEVTVVTVLGRALDD